MNSFKALFPSAARLGGIVLVAAGLAASADLPTAKSIAAEMGVAWNIGNSMEVPKNPTDWGNPIPTQKLIDSAKAAGFKTIRIPCAWYSHTQADSLTIDPAWLAQVKAVVDYCIKDSLFVVLNSHWDMGWLEEHIDAANQTVVNKRQGAYWRQIANTFKTYDRHLLFAGANEPAVQDAYGTVFGADRVAVLNSYLQTFIDTVRATGGNNATRTLIVQGPHADIELSKTAWTTLPTDKATGRLMAELHFYPYQWALMEQDAEWGKVYYYWGKQNLSTTDVERNTGWCDEAFVDSEFNILKRQYVDKGIPVLLGEFGAVKRMSLTGAVLERHILSRRYYYNYVVKSALAKGIIPAVWDAGGKGDMTMTVLDRTTGGVFDLGLLNAIRSGAGLTKLVGDTSVMPVTGANAMKVLYSAKDSSFGQVDLGVAKPNFGAYDSIVVRAYINGQVSPNATGGYVSLSMVTMSKSWTWREASMGTPAMNTWTNFSIAIGSDTTNKKMLVPADPTKVDFFALQAYSKGYNGTIYIDYIVFKTKAGVSDTLYSFNQTVPSTGKGNVESVSMVPVSSVASDVEWKTATKAWGSTGIMVRGHSANGALRSTVSNGSLRVTYSAQASGAAQATLSNLKGETIWTNSVQTTAGANAFEIPVSIHGAVLLRVQQGSILESSKVYLP